MRFEVQEEELLQSRWPQRRIHSSEGGGWWSALDDELSKVRIGTGQAHLHTTTNMRGMEKAHGLTAIGARTQKTTGYNSEAKERKEQSPGARRVDSGEIRSGWEG